MVVRDFLSVYASQLIRYFFPIFFLFVLTDKLPKSDVAFVMTLQSLAFLIGQVLEYGFGVYGSREIAKLDNESDIRGFVSSVFSAQIILLFPAILICWVACKYSPVFDSVPSAYLIAFLYSVAVGFIPSWYFQGLRKIYKLAIVEIAALLVCMAAMWGYTYYFNGVDPVVFSLLMMAGGWGALIFAWSLVRKETNFCFDFFSGCVELKNGFAIFLIKISSSSYTAGSVWMASLVCSVEDVGKVGGVLRVIGACTNLYTPLLQLFLPRIVSSGHDALRHRKLIFMSGVLYVSLGFSLFLFIFVFSDLISKNLLHDQSAKEWIVLSSVIFFPISLTMFFSSAFHLPNNRDKALSIVTMLGAIFIASGIYSAGAHWGGVGVIYSRVAGEFFILTMSFIVMVLSSRKGG